MYIKRFKLIKELLKMSRLCANIMRLNLIKNYLRRIDYVILSHLNRYLSWKSQIRINQAITKSVHMINICPWHKSVCINLDKLLSQKQIFMTIGVSVLRYVHLFIFYNPNLYIVVCTTKVFIDKRMDQDDLKWREEAPSKSSS